MHYYLEREESDFIQSFNLQNLVLLKDNADLITLLSICDIAISDNSSAIFDVIQADKPVLVADFWNEDFLDNKHKTPIFYKRGRGGALTYSDSIEQVLKRKGKIPSFGMHDELSQKIKQTFLSDFEFSRYRKEIREELFMYQDENCGKRGAVEIQNLIEGILVSRKGIMFHSYQNAQALNSRYQKSTSRFADLDIFSKNNIQEIARRVPEFKVWLVSIGWTEDDLK